MHKMYSLLFHKKRNKLLFKLFCDNLITTSCLELQSDLYFVERRVYAASFNTVASSTAEAKPWDCNWELRSAP